MQVKKFFFRISKNALRLCSCLKKFRQVFFSMASKSTHPVLVVYSRSEADKKLVTLSGAIEVTGSVKLQHNVSALC